MKIQYSKFITLLIILIIMLFGVFYFNRIIDKKIESIQVIKETLENNKTLPNQEEVLDRVTQLNKKIDKLSSYLVDLSNPVLFIEQIENLAGNYNLLISVNSFNVPEKSTEESAEKENEFVTQKVELDFSVIGSSENIRSFVYHLENLNKNLNIDSLRVSKNINEEAIVWSAIINLNALAK